MNQVEKSRVLPGTSAGAKFWRRNVMVTFYARIRQAIVVSGICMVLNGQAFAQVKPPMFPDVGVYDIGGGVLQSWSEQRPARFHVVLILSAFEPSSEALLKSLGSGSSAYAGEGLNVFVEGSAAQVDAFVLARKMVLPKAAWKRVNREALAIALRQGGTPQMHGVDPKGTAVWLFAGVPQPQGKALAMISDWTGRSSLAQPAAQAQK